MKKKNSVDPDQLASSLIFGSKRYASENRKAINSGFYFGHLGICEDSKLYVSFECILR